MKKVLVLILVGVLSLGVVGCSKKEGAQEVLVSAAASLTDVLRELSEEYGKVDKSTKLIFTFGSSGALQTQIEEGAPVDVFISAGKKQMKTLDEKELMAKDSIKDLLINKIVLIAPKDSNIQIKSFEELTDEDVKKIAIGDPGNVPVGQYSEEIFTNLGLKDTIESKLILGSDVRAVLTWVEGGEVDCGIVYATDAYTTHKVKIITEAPEGSHKEVTYPVGVVKSSKNMDKAKDFVNFLSTDKAKEIFEKYGFTMK